MKTKQSVLKFCVVEVKQIGNHNNLTDFNKGQIEMTGLLTEGFV